MPSLFMHQSSFSPFFLAQTTRHSLIREKKFCEQIFLDYSTRPFKNNFNNLSPQINKPGNFNMSSSGDNEPVPTLVVTALDLHNELRKKHGAPPLKLDHRLCLQAQGLAQALADFNKEGDPPSGVGRNFYRVTRTSLEDPTKIIQIAVNQWYDSNPDYNFTLPLASRDKADSFSQLVWVGSTDFGIGVAMSLDKKFISVVALYSPGGNTANESDYKDNVRPAMY